MADDRHIFRLSPEILEKFDEIRSALMQWANEHPGLLGVAEMATGAALLYGGVQTGAVALGTDVVLTTGAKLGAVLGATAGGLAGYALGGIGIAVAGTAIAVPAALLAAIGATTFAFAGYTIGDMAHKLVGSIDMGGLCGSMGLVSLGVALLLDGGRRIASSQAVQAALSMLRDGAIHLGRVAEQAVLSTLGELADWLEDLRRSPAMATATAATVAGSTALAYSAAAGSVTVLGSNALGAVGLAMGLVSVPIWPVVLVGGAATAVSMVAWRIAKRWSS